MNIAILGDIHGNHRALRAVLAAASSLGVEMLLITGDLVGYYDQPLAVMGMLESWPCYIVRGNHEDMLSIARNNEAFLKKVDVKYGTGLRSAIKQLNECQLDKLCSLPHPLYITIDNWKILLCHGTPWSNAEYIYPDSSPELLQRCVDFECDLVVLGNSHYQMLHKIGQIRLMNPGSVGQPRDSRPGAHWALFDTISGDIKFFNETYDYLALVKECKEINPELPYLSEVLVRK